jgi:hypothetical protein
MAMKRVVVETVAISVIRRPNIPVIILLKHENKETSKIIQRLEVIEAFEAHLVFLEILLFLVVFLETLVFQANQSIVVYSI